MKRILLLLIAIVVCVGCKKEKTEGNELTWVQIVANYDTDGKGPEGEMCVYDITKNHVSDYTPFRVLGTDWEPIHFIHDVNGEYVYPIYSHDLKSDKDSKTGLYKNQSTFSIFSDKLNNVSKYLLVIELPDNNCYTYKVVDWPKEGGIKLTKSFPRQTNLSRQYIEW